MLAPFLLSGLALLASLFEVGLTLVLVGRGKGTEANPLVRWALRLFPGAAFLVATGLTVALCLLALYLIGSGGWPGGGYFLLAALVAVRILSVGLNLRVLLRRK